MASFGIAQRRVLAFESGKGSLHLLAHLRPAFLALVYLRRRQHSLCCRLAWLQDTVDAILRLSRGGLLVQSQAGNISAGGRL